jgi:hypothetical protein
MTIQSLAEEIAFDYNKSFDKETTRRLELAIIGYRASIIREEYARTGRFSNNLVVTLTLKVIGVPEEECCTKVEGCKIQRTELKVPKPVRVKDGTSFLYVGDTDGGTPFTFAQISEINFLEKGNRFAKKRPYYTYENGYIYIHNVNTSKIRISFVPDNLEDLGEIKDCHGDVCDIDLTIPSDMSKQIKALIKAEQSGIQPPISKDIKIDQIND